MPYFFRVLAAGMILTGAMAGCSTPAKRARENAAAFRQLSPADQKLVLDGHTRPGLSEQAVYIAWGRPDWKTTATGDGKGGPVTEKWIYRQRLTILEPPNSYDYFGPDHGYGDLPDAPWLRPGFGIGGIENEGLLWYHPHVRSLDICRVAEFSQGNVDRFKTAEGSRSARADHPPSATSNTRPAAAKLPLHRTQAGRRLQQTGCAARS